MARTETRDEIILAGSELIAKSGFGQTGLDKILKKARVPKGSFYYYFASKEDFGLAVIDRFAHLMLENVRAQMHNAALAPLERIRGYLQGGLAMIGGNACKRGCLMGDLGQELAHQNEVFRKRIAEVFDLWKREISGCLLEAQQGGCVRPELDPDQVADFILSGWEGAILRAKVMGTVQPMKEFMDVLFERVLAP